MKLTIETNFAEVRKQLGDLGRQADFAMSRALNATAKKVQQALPAGLEQQLDRPTPFTKNNSTFISKENRATKDKLEVAVLFKDKQAEYLRYQVEGGVRQPKGRALRLPSAIGLDAFGNLPRNTIKQLVAVAQRERKLGKNRTTRVIKVSNKVDLFYGDPTEAGLPGAPVGIYKRVKLGNGRGQLIPLIVFPEQSARYEKRLDLVRIARPVVEQNPGVPVGDRGQWQDTLPSWRQREGPQSLQGLATAGQPRHKASTDQCAQVRI